jgi:hypothetical protein
MKRFLLSTLLCSGFLVLGIYAQMPSGHEPAKQVLASTIVAVNNARSNSPQGPEHTQTANSKPDNALKKSMKIESLHLLSPTEGWVAGQKNLLRTTDGGRGWNDITPTGIKTRIIRDAFFIDSSKGWVAMETLREGGKQNTSIEIAVTSDGGSVWSVKPLPRLGDEYTGGSISIDFVNSLQGWVMVRLTSNSNFSRGALFTTSDGGDTWSRLPAPPIGDPAKFITDKEGWLAGGPEGNGLYATRDGGNSWKPVSVSPPEDGYKTSLPVYTLPIFQNSRDGVLQVTFTNTESPIIAFYNTHDGGDTWQLMTFTNVSGRVDPGVRVAPSIINSTNIITAVPNKAGITIVQEAGKQQKTILFSDKEPDASVSKVDFISSTQGWILISAGNCAGFKSQCTQETKLFTTSDGGQTLTEIKLPSPPTGLNGNSFEPNTVGVSMRKGFDKCAAATVTDMQTWWNSSPYFDANIYMGGVNRGCSQANLNSSWVSQIFSQGWKLIPTWVGPQATCTTCATCSQMSSNPTTAQSQGMTEADSAANAAAALGLNPQTIIYYDMERYNPDATCSTAVKAFINGWVQRMHARGNLAGVYGSPGNAQDDWASIANPPDAVWIAKWDGRETVFGLTPLSDALWSNDQRIHQYAGGHNETFGGITFNIDNDISDGPLAVGTMPSSPNLTPFQPAGWSDKIVVSNVSGTNADSSPLRPTDTLFIDWAVINNGAAATSSTFFSKIFVDGVERNTWSTSPPLDVNFYAFVQDYSIGTLSAGPHTIKIVVDATGVITESNEGDNEYTKTITIAPVTTRTLTVASSPTSGVSITVSPNDNNGAGSGVTQFSRTYNDGSMVTLTAPATAGGNNFQKWQRDGVDFSNSQATNVTMDANHSMTAVYVAPPRALTVESTNPASGVSVTVSPSDNNGQSSGVTQFTRTYNANTNVTLTAPATAGGNNFQKWQRDGADFSFTQTTSITVDVNHTMTAVYVVAPPQPKTLMVASSNPASGVSVTVSPSDNNGAGSGVTQFTRTYNDGTVVTLTAPATAGGNSFQKWQRDGVDVSTGQTTNVTMDTNHTMTAVYVLIPPTTRALTVASSNPASGVSITVSPNDNNGSGNGVTQFSRTYNDGTVVTLTAPATTVGNNFQKWQRDGTDFSTNQTTNVTMDANHTMTAVYAGGPTSRTVRVVDTSAAPGNTVNISIDLASQGDENALGFSLNFDTTVLSSPVASLGSDGSGATVNSNSSQVGSGRFGIALALSAGQTFASGIRHIVVVSFTVASAPSTTTTQISFGDQPISREVSDPTANTLTATYLSGTITFSTGFEGDVAPRPNGNNNGSVTIADWVQVGRFVAGLDTANAGSEFQRADCAPRTSLGNGSITISDWVQAGRYAAGLDPVLPAGGSTSASFALSESSASAQSFTSATSRTVRVVNATFIRGQTNSLAVLLDSQGDENALGFSLNFDPGLMVFSDAMLGSDAAGASFNVNSSQAGIGRVGIAMALPAGSTFAAGSRFIVVLHFNVPSGAGTVSTQVSLGDQPIAREVSDPSANVLSAAYVDGTVSIQPTAVKMISFTATGYDDGVQIQWKTGLEVDNLGFNLYREKDGGRKLINPQLMAGSALMTGAGVRLEAGRSYSWWDETDRGKGASRYWLEDVDLNGKSTWHGPISVQFVGGTPSLRTSISFLSKMGGNASQTAPVSNLESRTHNPSMSAAQMSLSNTLAAQLAVKIVIRADGWYRVSQSQLVAAGLDPKVDARYLQLFVDGRQQPLSVDLDKNGMISAIGFYGTGVDNPYTQERIYWLVGASEFGSRIQQIKARGPRISSEGFPYTVERKDRTIYFSALKNGEQENFFGAVVGSEPVDQSMILQHVDQEADGQAWIEVSLQGVTTIPHLVGIYLNGTYLGDVSFGGQTMGGNKFSFSQSSLREGANQVRLVAKAGPSDISLVDFIRLTYWHDFSADDNVLQFTVPGNQSVTVNGFSNGSIRVFDITDPEQVEELTGKVRQKKGTFAITVASPEVGERTMLAIAEERVNKPVSVAANKPLDLRRDSNAADLIIITPKQFFPDVEPLKALRESQGLSVILIDVENIYDAFSFGQKSPEAIKEFLQYAKSNWPRPPRFVLLVGDGSYDPKNYLGHGDFDLIPAKLVDTSLMETASDDWYTDFSGGKLSEIAVGRLPTRTSSETSALVSKIIGYERSSRSNEALLVADNSDGFNFETASSEVRRFIPNDIRVNHINRGQTDAVRARKELLDTINRGQKIVNYMGHGSVDQWRGNLLTNNDAKEMSNEDHLSLFVMMTCLNGYFQDPALDSLAESLLNAQRGGAVAVWASAGMTEPTGQQMVDQELYRLLFSPNDPGGQLTIGEAIVKAKAIITDSDIRRTWILLGDPSMRLK